MNMITGILMVALGMMLLSGGYWLHVVANRPIGLLVAAMGTNRLALGVIFTTVVT